MRAAVRRLLLAATPDSERLRFLAYKPKFESWRKRYTGTHPMFADRKQMYEYLNTKVIGASAMTYLEFGVYKGDSILFFSHIHANPASRFVGFDTFEGLPEDWTEFTRVLKKSSFNAGGVAPETPDSRVSFVKGLFQDTLPEFIHSFRATGQLVIHNDSDLYSATMYVLTRANDIIASGTIIIFDELYSPLHEFRALEDYCAAYMRSYEVLAATDGHAQVAIRMK